MLNEGLAPAVPAGQDAFAGECRGICFQVIFIETPQRSPLGLPHPGEMQAMSVQGWHCIGMEKRSVVLAVSCVIQHSSQADQRELFMLPEEGPRGWKLVPCPKALHA